MSNPGVKVLVDFSIGANNLRIEDNIGECIHIHIDEFRFDLTIDEFIDFSGLFEDALNNKLSDFDLSYDDFDPLFISEISSNIVDIESTSLVTKNLKELKVFNNKIFNRLVSIKSSMICEYFEGKSNRYLSYKQKNVFASSNAERADFFRDFTIDDYKNGRYAILINDQNIIRDGQHRLSALFLNYKNNEVDVLNIKFKENKMSISKIYMLKSAYSTIKSEFLDFLRLIKRILLRIISILRK